MRQDSIGMQVLYEHLLIFKPVIRDIVYKFVHFCGMFIEGGKRILKSHEIVESFEHSCHHHSCRQISISAHFLSPCSGFFPAFRAVGGYIRRLNLIAPAGYILQHSYIRCGYRHCSRSIFGEIIRDTPSVQISGAFLPVAAQISADRIANELESFKVVQLPVRSAVFFQQFKK